jgi:hypothetical protein
MFYLLVVLNAESGMAVAPIGAPAVS